MNYFDDLLNKDILRRYRIRKTAEMKALIRYYLSNTANLTTLTSAGKFLEIQPHTVERFLGYCEDVYLVFELKRFSFKVREQEKSPRKIYSIDSGLCNTMGFRFSENRGKIAENTVFLALKQRELREPQMELFYWKDIHHREVDFVIKEDHENSGDDPGLLGHPG